jgi:hypothetical protein
MFVAFNSRDAWFEYRFGHRRILPSFLFCFPQYIQVHSGMMSQLGNYQFLPCFFKFIFPQSSFMSRGSVVGIVTAYELDDRWVGSSSVGRIKNFQILRNVQTGFGVHPISYLMSTCGFYPGVKATEA